MYKPLGIVVIGIIYWMIAWGVMPPNNVYGQTIPAPPTEATYTVTFTSTWSQETHPHESFPSGAHFSSLIGATHSLSSTLWMSDTLASAGMEQMAETGGTAQLRTEINALGEDALMIISGAGLSQATGSVVIPDLIVDRTHPAVTLVTMIAPSPDWFVGVHGLSLLDENGLWRDEVVVTLYPYDAGTDDGIDYRSQNAESDPHQPIQQVRGQFPFSTEPIGTFTFIRQPIYETYLPLISR